MRPLGARPLPCLEDFRDPNVRPKAAPPQGAPSLPLPCLETKVVAGAESGARLNPVSASPATITARQLVVKATRVTARLRAAAEKLELEADTHRIGAEEMVRDVERVLLLGQSECQAQTAAISVEVERAEMALADSVSGLEKDRVEVNRLADEKVSGPRSASLRHASRSARLPHASYTVPHASHIAPLPLRRHPPLRSPPSVSTRVSIS